MPGDVRISDTTFYKVTFGQPIQLAVTIGHAQVGGTALSLNGQPVPIDNNTGRALIGAPGQDLRNSVLSCVTTVRDINSATNSTSVIHDLSGGPQAKTFPYAVSVGAAGGHAIYDITFILN